jgi:hypothetical protein
MIDPFRLCVALGPIAIYALLLGSLNLSRRPFLVGGMRDAAALGLAVSGLIVIGPMELFFPEAAAARIGPAIWIVLVVFYAMLLVLVLLLLRPRLILYNIAADQLRPILADLVPKLDAEARWAGDSVALPTLGVQFHIDRFAWMRNMSLVAIGAGQSHAGWRQLERSLAEALARVEVGRNPRGLTLITAGVAILTLLVLAITRDPGAVPRGLFDLLRV